MGVNTKAIGLAAVSLILSGLTVVTLATTRAKDPIEVLDNQHPAIHRSGDEAFYSLAVLARNKHDRVSLEFSMLMLKRLDSSQMIDPKKEYDSTSVPEDVLGNSRKLAWLRNRTKALGLEPERFARTLKIRETLLSLSVEDYGVLKQILGQETILDQPLVFCAAVDRDGKAYYMEGVSDFFYQPETNIKTMGIIHGEEETLYVPDGQATGGSERLPLSQAPRGYVEFESARRDDTIKVFFTVKSRSLPRGFYTEIISFLQIIKIRLNGKLCCDPIVNIMEAGLG